MRLEGAITEGSGAVNEDGWGYIGSPDDITAAWVFDGVTGINGRNLFTPGTDAAWLVAKAHEHLLNLAGLDFPLREILSRLVQALIIDFNSAAERIDIPSDYDPPRRLSYSAETLWQLLEGVAPGRFLPAGTRW